jgi:hypothetical protein
MAETGSNVGVPPLSLLKEISGLEFLTRIVDGRLPRPPITETLGFALTEVSSGFALFTISRTSATTIRSAPCMAAWRRRCSTPA